MPLIICYTRTAANRLQFVGAEALLLPRVASCGDHLLHALKNELDVSEQNSGLPSSR